MSEAIIGRWLHGGSGTRGTSGDEAAAGVDTGGEVRLPAEDVVARRALVRGAAAPDPALDPTPVRGTRVGIVLGRPPYAAAASASRVWVPPRQTWQMASASASAASAGLGAVSSPSSRVTIVVT